MEGVGGWRGASAEPLRSHPESGITVNVTCRRWQPCLPPPLHLLVRFKLKPETQQIPLHNGLPCWSL